MQSKTIRGNSVVEINAALEKQFDSGFKPTLGLVFISVMQNIPSFVSLLTGKNIQVFGTEVSEDAMQFQQMEMPEADALVMFAWIGRIDAFGPMTSEELQGIQSVYKVPMTGFFTYGEYGRATGGKNEFHNMTCCWVALKEL